MSSLKFGTSGLRGLVSELVGWPSYAYVLAFLRHLDRNGTPDAKRVVLFGRDLRASSPDIVGNCLASALHAGYEAIDCGALPTPALALAALENGCPAVMVTGSHIPDDRNGLKFYRRDGEITKADEEGIHAQFEAITSGGGPIRLLRSVGPLERNTECIARYRKRYLDFFPANCLSGLQVGVFTHSSVARDILLDVLVALGAAVEELGRSEMFIPVDTEAHRPEDLAQLGAWGRRNRYDAIVSTDGDADRPLVADESGVVIRGDLLGLITARHLGLRTLVTPVTSSTAVETSGIGQSVIRTKVGSPFVIQGMVEAAARGDDGIGGFEANGGFLHLKDIHWLGRNLQALPTRDALLPILASLAEARALEVPLSALIAQLHAGYAAAHRLQNVHASQSFMFMQKLATDAFFLGEFFAPIGTLASINVIDGFKATFASGCSVHFRPSGNAPELRCYVEAGSQADADQLLRWSLAQARDHISGLSRLQTA